ncbi:hypothetical protein CRV08_15195 [Halarcobacter ebronensis]|uniref:Pesticidal crystal protein Cry22Aa Ig-like domain-containing protein n=1 Tax=Halarcobacter ebronensis TaxID=1462615 RepID=A0A4Q0Y5L7_9BACT|nr:DUF5011 domain-containing protein [Halarcobacter ebronensis]RXJ65460.1 hypothetical protein CRV08_15195 [Halarcobacter ebronensis]
MGKNIVRIVFVLLLFVGLIKANEGPIITYNGASDVQVLLGEPYKDLGATAKDKEDGDLSGSIQTTSNVNTSLAGSYKVTYSVTNSSGITTILSRNVNVVKDKTDYKVSWENKFNFPAQDKDGWSILTPSLDSRIVYVSSSQGDDSIAEIYDITKVSDVYNPSNIKAYKTIDAAYKQIREGYPDYMLLKRGDVWTHGTIKVKGGLSIEKRLVIGAYGDESLDRPIIKTGISGGLNFDRANGNYSAVIGIKFEANGRNPNSEDFVGFSNVGRSKGFEAINWKGQFKGGILIEDCWFDWYYSNTVLNKNVDKSGKDISSLSDVIIRRNIISNSYAHQGHSDGLVLIQTSVLLEENVFDHNGWYQKPNAGIKQKYIDTEDKKYINDVEGQATFHNTSVKFYAPKNTIFRKNMFLRTSSTANAFSADVPSSLDSNEPLAWNVLVDNNFYVEGEAAITFGGYKDKNDGARWKNILVTNNVLTGIGRTQPVNREVGYGLILSDWQNGLVQNNILTKWGKKDVYLNTEGIKSTGHVTNTVFEKNILNDIVSNKAVVILSDMDNKKRVDGAINNIFFINNEINLSKEDNGRVIDYGIMPEKQTFANNYFYSAKDKSEWFRTTSLRTMGFEEFKTLTKDTTTLPEQKKYFDDSRTIGSYLKSLGYGSNLNESTEVDVLAKLVTTRKKGNWNKNLTTENLNEYFKEGFVAILDDKTNNENYQVAWENKFNFPAQDKDGWSILTPSLDSRIVYVSSSQGDDSIAEIYDITKVSDVYNPSNIKAYKTIDAAYKQIREGYPDYMLLKRGDVWTHGTIKVKGGLSIEKRLVIGAYGDESLDRPIIKTGISGGLRVFNVSYTALIGIKFEANGRNPNSEDFVGFEDVGNSKGYELKNLSAHNLIEDCWFDWYLIGISIQDNNIKESESGEKETNVYDIIIRRNLVTNSYGQIGHSQGIYSFVTSSFLEENIFDHNGWYQHPNNEIQERYKDNKEYYLVGPDGKVKVNHLGDAEGQATIYNHNIYFAESRDTVFRKNIFLRSSSIGTKFTSNTNENEEVPNKIKAWNILVDNNFYAGGEVGISLGGNKDRDNGPRWQNILITNNVLTSIGINHPTNRDLGWGIGVSDWKGGLVKDNIITTWGDPTILKNNKAIITTGHMTDTLFDGNIVYNIIGTQYAVLFSDKEDKGLRIDGALNNITFTNNEINLPNAYDTRIMAYGMKPEIQNFSDNYFYSSARESRWFDSATSKYIPIETYRELSEDTTSLALQREYVEPNRTINSFLESFGYETNLNEGIKIEILSNLLKKQRKGNWDKKLDAGNINNYFRAGFCISGNESCR